MDGGMGVLAPEAPAEEEEDDDDDRRSEMLALARVFVLVRKSASCDGEKDHSLNCEVCRYRASSVAIARLDGEGPDAEEEVRWRGAI